MVFNKTFKKLHKDIGFCVRNYIINHISYADDLVLIANDYNELQFLFNIVVNALVAVGLRINLPKYFTMAWIKEKKLQKLIYDKTRRVTVNNNFISSIEVNSSFKYLVTSFTPTGLYKQTLLNKILK